MTCRICYEPDNLITVCNCDGSVKWVHANCAQKWIDTSLRLTCEICDHPFDHELFKLPPRNVAMPTSSELTGMGLLAMSTSSELIGIGLLASCMHTMGIWLQVFLRIPGTWLSVLICMFYNMCFLTFSVCMWNRRQRVWKMVVSYFHSYCFLNSLMCFIAMDIPENIWIFLFINIVVMVIVFIVDIFIRSNLNQ